MKKIIGLLFSIAVFSSALQAADDNAKGYETFNVIGVSFSIAEQDNVTYKYIELRDQICFEIKDFPIIPYIEPDIFIELSEQKPNILSAFLFGMKKNIIERGNMILSVDLGSGIATGMSDGNNAGVIGRLGLDAAYKNLVLRCLEVNMMSGFAYKGTVSMGLSYKF